MRCFKCKKAISKGEDYIIMTHMNNNEEVHTDYIHKSCWDNFCNQLNGATSSLAKSNYLLNAMGNHMKKIGIISEPKEEYVI